MDIQKPTPGRVILYRPNLIDGNDVDVTTNQADVITGMVTQAFGGLTVNVVLFPPFAPVAHKGSVRHASQADRWDNEKLPIGVWVYATDSFDKYVNQQEAVGNAPGPGF